MGNSQSNSIEIIRYNIPTDKCESFEDAYAAAGEILKQSHDCLGYNILRGGDEPNHYLITINCTSIADHLDGFKKALNLSLLHSC